MLARAADHAPGTDRWARGVCDGRHLEVIFRVEVRYPFPPITVYKSEIAISVNVIPFRFGWKPHSHTESGARPSAKRDGVRIADIYYRLIRITHQIVSGKSGILRAQMTCISQEQQILTIRNLGSAYAKWLELDFMFRLF